ncbi:STELLO glycosyltransferase family protein [Patescibacteria group bacterium]|nr:STELLO glycosyltransferase family protein [Patescibacteria group bacterium]
MNKRSIVITTINSKNVVLDKFSKIKDYNLIIVGDKKSPTSYDLNAEYINIDKQLSLFPKFAKSISYNHYARKNIGYLYAIIRNSDIIAESDDDNMPKKDWGLIPTANRLKTIIAPQFPNVYKEFTNAQVWPRGFPLDLILSKQINKSENRNCKILIWQGLADGSPDVDAVYRLVINKDIKFKKGVKIALAKGVLSPFNSQNTIWLKQAFCFMYLPHTVTFRYTDILRSFVAQYGIWARNGQLAFISSTVIQKRNPHDFLNDFIDEYPMYKNFKKVIEILDKCVLKGDNNDLLIMYKALYKTKIVKKKELSSVSLWLKAISKFKK